jgi:TonB family protein
MGDFSVSGLAEGDYVFEVQKAGMLPVFGAFHIVANESHTINVVALAIASSPRIKAKVGAAAPLREAVRPARDPAKPPKVRPAQVRKTVTPTYPSADRKAGVHGVVKIAMIILRDGTVNDLVVLSAPSDSLAVAALVAVRRGLYSPTYWDGQPIEASLTVDIDFHNL